MRRRRHYRSKRGERDGNAYNCNRRLSPTDVREPCKMLVQFSPRLQVRLKFISWALVPQSSHFDQIGDHFECTGVSYRGPNSQQSNILACPTYCPGLTVVPVARAFCSPFSGQSCTTATHSDTERAVYLSLWGVWQWSIGLIYEVP